MEKIIFSEQEKFFIVQLVADEKEVIENKKCDSNTIWLKNEAWKRITFRYNSEGFSHRTLKQLKKCWENIKQRRRLQTIKVKQERSMADTMDDPPHFNNSDRHIEFIEVSGSNLDEEEIEIKHETKIDVTYPPLTALSTTPGTSTEPQTTIQPTSSAKKRKVEGSLDCLDEKTLRQKKIRESVTQQRELHQHRMKTARMEYLLSVLKVRQQIHQMKEDGSFDAECRAEAAKEMHLL